MARPYSCASSIALTIAGVAALLAGQAPAHAQGPSEAPVPPIALPMATPEMILSLGVVQGDYVVPWSSMESPDQNGVSLHTHIMFARPSTATAGTAVTATNVVPMLATLLGSATMGLPPASLLGLPDTSVDPAATGSGPSRSFLPADLKTAYGLPSTGGAGTIVLIGAYDYPTALSDFNSFSTISGLPKETSTNPLLNSNKVFQVVYATGRQPNPQPSGQSYSIEAALDIEWAHAMAPNAKIVLVEATTNGLIDLLFSAVNKANNLPGVREVSMSYGSGEFSQETLLDPAFTKTGIVYFASSGDVGGSLEWPSSSPNVVGVGGTTLKTNTSTQAYVSETGWSGSGGGTSQVESKPSYQSGVTLNGTAFSFRSTPDVALLADPNTGVLVVYAGSMYAGVGGTSLAAPATAGIVNLSLSNRASTNAELTYVYSIYNNAALYSGNFRDITSGTAGSHSCLTGFDLVTGIGTPFGTAGY